MTVPYIPGASMSGASFSFPGGFVGDTSLTPNCPICAQPLQSVNQPFIPAWNCSKDMRAFTWVQTTKKALRMYDRQRRGFRGGTEIDRYKLRKAMRAEMRITEKAR